MKILFLAKPQSENFALPYTAELAKSDKVHSRFFANPAPICTYLRANAERYDLVWFEWANYLFNALTHYGPFPPPLMVRIHDYEVRNKFVLRADWDQVAVIWFINRDTQRDFNALVKGQEHKQIFLPNAVDPAQFDLVAEDSKHLAMISVAIQSRKRYGRAMSLLRLLPDDYRLTIRTSHQYGTLDIPTDLRDRVIHEDSGLDLSCISSKSDVVDFFRGKSHVLSTSDHEGFHYALAEGALCGLAPVCYNWEWGKAEDFWQPYVRYSLDGMADGIMNGMGPGAYHRDYVISRFSAKVLVPQLLSKISQVLAPIGGEFEL